MFSSSTIEEKKGSDYDRIGQTLTETYPGVIFQAFNLLLTALRYASKPPGAGNYFELSTERADAGKFDDFRLVTRDEVIWRQLKYSKDAREFESAKFIATRDNVKKKDYYMISSVHGIL